MWDSAAEAGRWYRTAEDDLDFARFALDAGFPHKTA